jgi:beta-phosphoglucomutase-like phosphatase (HAD superfamily)
MLRAIIFDCDGVIADTEPLHYRAFLQVLSGVVPVPTERDYFIKYVGLTDDAFIAALFEEAHRPLDAARRHELVREKGRGSIVR